MAPSEIKGHVMTVSLPVWGKPLPPERPCAALTELVSLSGHTKPLCALLARMVRIRPIHATICTSVGMRPQVVAEVERQFVSGEDADLKQLIRCVQIFLSISDSWASGASSYVFFNYNFTVSWESRARLNRLTLMFTRKLSSRLTKTSLHQSLSSPRPIARPSTMQFHLQTLLSWT